MAKQPSKGRKPVAKPKTAASESAKTPDLDTVEDAVEAKPEVEVTLSDPAKETPVQDESPADDSVIAPSPEPVEPEPPAPDPIPEQELVHEPIAQPAPAASGSFLPLVLGGLLAGAIGYVVAYWQYADQGDPTAAVTARVNDLEQDLANLPGPTDVSGIEAQINTLMAETADVPAQITALDDRLSIVERQPSADGTLQEAAVAAYERDIAELRSQIEAQQAGLQAMADEARGQLDATRAEALSIEQNAVDAARAATARAALARVQAAIESGAPIGAALAELGDTLDAPLPDALSAVAEGTPTLSSLQDAFPDAARAALATARSEGTDGEASGGLTAFLRNQFEVRSVTPQEGDSVDAILSRAEGALSNGRLADALAEVATLPEVSRADLSEWTAAAELRAAALDAADTLATTIDDN